MSDIPGQVLIQIPDEAIQAKILEVLAGMTILQGPPGAPGAVAGMQYAPFAAGAQTNSPTYTGTGHQIVVTPTGTRVFVRARGVVGHSLSDGIVHLSILKNGTAVHGTASGLTVARVRNNDNVECFVLEYMDSNPGQGPNTYELAWRVVSGYATLGRRWSSTDISVPTSITALDLV